MKKRAILIIAAAFACSFTMTSMASQMQEIPDIYSVSYGEAFDGPEAQVIEGEVYVSDALRGASAIYISGGEHTFDSSFIYGAGTMTDDDRSAERASQFGYCADVLANGYGTVVTLNDPLIVSDPESYANGVFASAMAKIYVNGGQIYTNNAQGHGIDATYMGHVYVKNTVIHTAGSASGALATDYGGGFINAENIDCTTELGGSPGIYCAGSSIIMCKDSVFNAINCEGVMNAHDHGIVVLENCRLFGETSALNGHQAMPSPEMSAGSYCFVFGGTLESGSGPVIKEDNGRTETTIVGAECILGDYSYAIEALDDKGGILTVNLWDTQLSGDIYSGAGASVTINLYEGAVLTGDVSGEGEVVINVYPGGVYEGSFETVQMDEAAEKPVIGEFDDYLTALWAAGMQKWDARTMDTYVNEVEPVIIEGSACALIEEGFSKTAFDPAVTDISENGVDPELLDTSSAAGFGAPGESGGGESGGGESDGESAPEGESGESAPEG